MPQKLSEMRDLVEVVLDAIPSALFVVDHEVRIIGFNRAAGGLLTGAREGVLRRRAGDILHCLHAVKAPDGCGSAKRCEDCVVRNSVREAAGGNRVVRARERMEMLRDS
ncbi:MAG: hypothetical protein ACLGPL_03135, partial [Acidobacteriota bacterium]